MFTLDSFYHSKKWEKFREVIINDRLDALKHCNYCSHCHKEIVNRYDLIVHHKIELTDLNVNDYNISLNPDNVEIVCYNCHNKHHKRFGYENKKQVVIVYGSPFNGGSEWVNAIAQPNDIIVDMNSIYQSISNNARYFEPDRLKSPAFEIRDKLYEVIKYRNGKWANAYVIVTAPLIMDRQRLKQRVNATDVKFIEATKEECIDRLSKVGLATDLEKKQLQYIDDWFNKYQSD